MKKIRRFTTLLAAMVFMLGCFVACSNDSSGGDSNIVTQWESTDFAKAILIFYNDGSFEFKITGPKGTGVPQKGTYTGDTTKDVTISLHTTKETSNSKDIFDFLGTGTPFVLVDVSYNKDVTISGNKLTYDGGVYIKQ